MALLHGREYRAFVKRTPGRTPKKGYMEQIYADHQSTDP
jgi:hypothetical protein